jgi:hypothetical protein
MKAHHIRCLVLLALLLVCPATFAQTSAATKAAANQSWPSFWRRVTSAINSKDRVDLLKMMPDNFSDGGGGLTASEWLKFIDENERNGSWKDLQKSFSRGSLIHSQWSAKGIPTRVTRDKHYYFEFRKNKRWYFAGVVGD